MDNMKTYIGLVLLSFINIGCSSTTELFITPSIATTPKIVYIYSDIFTTKTVLSKEQMNIQEKEGCVTSGCHNNF